MTAHPLVLRGIRGEEFAGSATASRAVLLAAAVLLLARGAASQASLPPARLEPPAPITYFIADGEARNGFLPGDPELAEWALAAWQRATPGRIPLEQSDEAHARIRVYWAAPGIGQYGETQAFLLDGRRGASLYIHPDMESLGPDIAVRARADRLLRDAIVYLTCLHELGHAFGLEHTADFADIMYSFQFGGDIVQYFGRYRRQIRSRADIARVSGLSPSDESRFRALYDR